MMEVLAALQLTKESQIIAANRARLLLPPIGDAIEISGRCN